MATSTPREASMAAVYAALNPYSWRGFSPELVARRVVAATDRQALTELLHTVPGAAVGEWGELPDPADSRDPRVAALVLFLDKHPWNQLRLHTLCRLMVRVLRDAA